MKKTLLMGLTMGCLMTSSLAESSNNQDRIIAELPSGEIIDPKKVKITIGTPEQVARQQRKFDLYVKWLESQGQDYNDKTSTEKMEGYDDWHRKMADPTYYQDVFDAIRSYEEANGSNTVIETPAAEHIATTNIYGQPMIVPVHNAVEGQTIHKPENSKPVITPDGGLMVVVGFNIPTTQDNSTTNIVIPSIPYTTGDTGTTTNVTSYE